MRPQFERLLGCPLSTGFPSVPPEPSRQDREWNFVTNTHRRAPAREAQRLYALHAVSAAVHARARTGAVFGALS